MIPQIDAEAEPRMAIAITLSNGRTWRTKAEVLFDILDCGAQSGGSSEEQVAPLGVTGGTMTSWKDGFNR